MKYKLASLNFSDELLKDLSFVLKSGNLVCGEECKKFENLLAEFLNVEYISVVSSGTSALQLALIAEGIKYGDYVIVPDFTFPATANAVMSIGAIPILAEVKNDFNIDTDNLTEKIVDLCNQYPVKGIIPVHEFGVPANISNINQIARTYNLKVIEDAACAFGSKYPGSGEYVGTTGNTSCFSFHPRKILTTGEGGCIITNNSSLDEHIKSIRNHGIKGSGINRFHFSGYNSRLTDIQATIGIDQLKGIQLELDKRKQMAEKYIDFFKSNDFERFFIIPDIASGGNWQTFALICLDEKLTVHIRSELSRMSIESNQGAYALSTQRAYKNLPNTGSLQFSKYLFNNTIVLPLHSGLTDIDTRFILDSIHDLTKIFTKIQ